MKRHHSSFLFLVFAALLLAGCATQTPRQQAIDEPARGSVLRSLKLDPILEERILALDPEHVSERDLSTTLSEVPAPRIVLLHGGVYPVHLLMESTGRFFTRMGYPERRIRDPYSGEWSYSPYDDSTKVAGLIAWEYEHSGLRPMLIGHSQGGIQAVKVLRELDGQMSRSLAVYNPLKQKFEQRDFILDPYTGQTVGVVHGVKVSYASVVGAGGSALFLPNQWNMIGHLTAIPNSVEDFTGFFITGDPIAWTLGGPTDATAYRHNGTASVRNVTLPITYSHVFVPAVSDLASDAGTRRWLDDYRPDSKADTSRLPLEAQSHVLWAGDVWYSVKKHWVLELQRLVRAHQELAPPRTITAEPSGQTPDDVSDSGASGTSRPPAAATMQ